MCPGQDQNLRLPIAQNLSGMQVEVSSDQSFGVGNVLSTELPVAVDAHCLCLSSTLEGTRQPNQRAH